MPLLFVPPPLPHIVADRAAYAPGKPASPSTEQQISPPAARSVTAFGAPLSPLTGSNSLPICGPSPRLNTLNCFNFAKHAAFSKSYPIPGKLSTVPLFWQDSWLIGTTKGFLMRVDAPAAGGYLPQLTGDNAALWGASSRQVMAHFRPPTIYAEDNTPTPSAEPIQLTNGVKWLFAASTPFVGTPRIQGEFVYVFAASQYLQAFRWDTGRLVWATRLAPSASLRLDADALAVTPDTIYVGNSLGVLLALNPADGSTQWAWQIPAATETQRVTGSLSAGPDRFTGIVAAPLVTDNLLVVSNAESLTQGVLLSGRTAQWSYPAGSVAKAIAHGSGILLGTSNGDVVKLDKATGKPLWHTALTKSSPIVTLFLTEPNFLWAATRLGQLFLLDAHTGKILDSTSPVGETAGEFFSVPNSNLACLSFAANGFRCFRVAP